MEERFSVFGARYFEVDEVAQVFELGGYSFELACWGFAIDVSYLCIVLSR